MGESLAAIASQYKGTEAQKRAISWFQASTGAEKQEAFGGFFRNSAPGSISFVAAFEHFKGLPHQAAAFDWLEENSQPATLAEFRRLWDEAKSGEIRLNVPFWNQLDNQNQPHRTCNTSSCAMVAKFLGAAIASDDQYWLIVNRFGDTTSHEVQTRALREIGIKSTFRTDLGFKDLDDSLEFGLPVVISILHRGPLEAPRGGHVLVVIGRTEKGDYIVNDPYGSVLDGYQGPVENGRGAVYSRNLLNHRWLLRSPNGGWGRLFYGS